ncbi:ABC transporter ATP-binding protein [Streptomyces sp. NPDC019396]|uniref:ABC transporter ATP-binding protein n=1 Tax=Streptomyces sp. NPDC019396 TaxID=3154687 RepID=UPI0033E381A4
MPAPTGGRLLAATARRVRPRLVLLTTALTVNSGTGVAMPVLLAACGDAVLRDEALRGPVTALVAVLVAGALAEAAALRLSVSTAAVGTAWLRMSSVRRLLALGPGSPYSVGESVTHVVQSAPQAASLPGEAAEAAVSALGSLAALVALWVVDWRAGLAFTVLSPLTAVVARRFIADAGEAEARYLDARTRMAGLLVTALSGARTIRAAGTLVVETERVVTPLGELSAAGHAIWRTQRQVVWKIGVLVALTHIAVLTTAGLDVAAGRISPGELLAVTGYLALATRLLDQIDIALNLAYSRAGASRLSAILDEPVIEGGPRRSPPLDGAVSLRDVTVHRSGERVLDRLDLEIPHGVSVALVGATGSGKSLLAALLGRLAEPDEGVIQVGGVPVAELELGTLRQTVSYAFERPVLAGRTLREAILFGRPDLPGSAAEDAARAAQADPFVRRMPGGYDTPVRLAPMSGGQLQRIGIARALARPALVYVLDDATSGVDSVTETQIGDAVTGRLGDRTRLVITHRATTAARCDLVAWLHAGRIRALAPHSDLCDDPDYAAVFARTAAVVAGPGTGASPAPADAPTAPSDEEQRCPADC